MIGCKRALFISEVGWRGIRELSLELLKKGLLVDVVIKGKVDKEVLEIITKPTGLRIKDVSRMLFRIYLFFYFLYHKILGNLEIVVVSKEEARKWARGFGIDAKLVIEKEKGYDLR